MISDTAATTPSEMTGDFQVLSSIETVDTFNDNPVDCGETVVSIVNHEKRKNSSSGFTVGSFLVGPQRPPSNTAKKKHQQQQQQEQQQQQQQQQQRTSNRPELPLPASKKKSVRKEKKRNQNYQPTVNKL